jgi:formylglycine-generating enzyme
MAISTDIATPRGFDGLSVRVTRAGTGVFDKEYGYDIVASLPDTIVLIEADALTEDQRSQPIRILVEGQLYGETKVSRSASVAYADRSLFLRMPLCNSCLRDEVCGDGQTCKAGACVSESIDAASLPTDDGAQALVDPECPTTASSCAGRCGESGCGDCPTGAVIDVPGPVTIDTTEVTREDFELWLDTNPHASAGGLFPECAVPTDFYPDRGCLADPEVAAGSRDKHPQGCVQWCAAHAYCAWAGKHLCRGVGNVFLPLDAPKESSEWFQACAGPTPTTYPYDDMHMDGVCNDEGTMTRPVGENMCSWQLGGPFDMTGNVMEWEDSCQGSMCNGRGGHYKSIGNARCTDEFRFDRSDVFPYLGFRCCGGL